MNEHEHATLEVDYVDKKMAYYTHLRNTHLRNKKIGDIKKKFDSSNENLTSLTSNFECYKEFCLAWLLYFDRLTKIMTVC